jgi:hypothetical protein
MIPCNKLQGIFDRKECSLFMIRSLTPPQAAENALAFAVQQNRTPHNSYRHAGPHDATA